MFERLLIPLDGSAAADAAVPLAEQIPTRLVYLLQVAPAGRSGHDGEPATAGEASLARAAERFRQQGRDVEVLRMTGDAAVRIAEAAADVDLIAMGTRGRGAGGRALFGSVADRVAREASVPTLVVWGGDRAAPNAPVRRVVVPLDGSARAEAALPVAAALADEVGVALHLIRVAEATLPLDLAVGATTPGALPYGVIPGDAYHETMAVAQRSARAYLEERAAGLAAPNRRVTVETRGGGAATELLAAVGPGDLVALASHGRSGLRRWLVGSVAERLIREAPAPILLVRSPPESEQRDRS